MATTSLFRLSELDISDHSLERYDQLPAISVSFALPRLGDDGSSPARLLGALDELVARYEAGSPSRKGKERAVDVQPISPKVGVDDAPRAGLSIWEQVQDANGAGPSSSSVFSPIETWDARDEAERRHVHMMSEDSTVFEALALHDEEMSLPPLQARKMPLPRQPSEILELLRNSTTGTTTSRDIVWDKRELRFKWTGGRAEGLQTATFVSYITVFMEIATAIRRLETVIDTHATTPLSPTHHALLHAVATYLMYLKQKLAAITENGPADISDENIWPALHAHVSFVRPLRDLAVLLCDIMRWPIDAPVADGLPARTSSLLTHLYGFFQAQNMNPSRSTPSTLATAYLLSQSSGPFLQLLHGWLGLSPCSADEDLDPTSQPWADLGITRTALAPAENGDLRWMYEFNSKRMPAFIPRENRRALFEAGKSLRLLREASSHHHPLCATDWGLETGWGWAEDHVSSSSDTIRKHTRRVRKEIEYWRRSTLDRSRLRGSTSVIRVGLPKKDRKRLPVSLLQSTMSTSTSGPSLAAASANGELGASHGPQAEPRLDDLWAQFSLTPGAHLQQSIATPLWAPSPLDSLHAFITDYLTDESPLIPPDTPSLDIYLSSHLLAPLLAHAKLISASLVSLYMNDLALLDHYDILRAFFLGGDVGFFERVSAALFGKDEAGAGEALGLGKRARTRARLGLGTGEVAKEEGVWGMGLGLGLSERARWPPGGAELAYALRTTLVDDDYTRIGTWEGIEDRIGFGVRSLPEDERDGQRARWMDPQAIEALDFLYLSYSAPTAIAPVLPASVMVKYQAIHNLLLRLCRVKTVTRTLYLDTIHPTPLFDEPVKQGIDSGSRPVSGALAHSRTNQELFPSRSKISFALHRLRFRMSGFIDALERYLLDTAIGSNWNVMRRKLEKLKSRTPGLDVSTPATPVEHSTRDTIDVLDLQEDQADSDDGSTSNGLLQLNSIDSLVVYHDLILDRILRACLLSPSAGYQVTYKVLMGLFGCILDIGKVVKQVERGTVGWQDGAETVEQIAKEWEERETVFIHALEKLSMRTQRKDKELGMGQGDERDLEILLGREDGEEEDEQIGADGGHLGELLLRVRLNLEAGKMSGPRNGRQTT